MNKKVVKTLIGLTLGFLLAWYILKIFFPEQFVLQINNESLIKIGTFIDSNVILSYICGAFTSYMMYWLYICAVCKKPKLTLKDSLIVIAIYVFGVFVELVDITLATYYSILAMIIYPAFLKAELKNVALVLSFHIIAQCLSLSIRGLSAMILSVNFMSLFVMTLECYFWLFLFYLLFNHYDKKEE